MALVFLFLSAQTIPLEGVLQFADYLYGQQDYAAALHEYRRYQFLTDSVREDIPERIITCLIELKKFDKAIQESSQLLDISKSSFLKGQIYFLAGKYDSSRLFLSTVGTPYKTDAKKFIGLGYALEFKFQEAGKYIELPDAELHYKKPLLGALCALFPGGGHLYCGRTGDAIFSFLVISTMGLLSYYYYDHEEDVKFGISLGATILFYAGNIYGGINAVRNYNYYQNERHLQTILKSAEE
jgi:tetratricopeptide (TPR) repeat protein